MQSNEAGISALHADSALSRDETEVARVMQICNACRYCEGYCAVFPAMTRRLEFPKADIHYLANLCHNCGACLYACQYAPPHEFAVNVPRAMARVRRATYAEFAWPAAFASFYRHNGLVLCAALALGLAGFIALALALNGTAWGAVQNGNFYAVLSHGLMVALFLPPFMFALLALSVGVRRFWRRQQSGPVMGDAAAEAAHDTLWLKYLDGGHGEGCNDEDDRFSQARRYSHQLTLYGFGLCFAATAVATLYHYVFDWRAPYELLSVPKLLGAAGGIAMVAGCVGLFWLNVRRHPLQQEPSQQSMDRGFILLLLLTAATGLLLMLVRATAAMPLALSVHLGAVMALFVTLPYGKFAHAAYRVAALLKWATERRRPSPLTLSGE